MNNHNEKDAPIDTNPVQGEDRPDFDASDASPIEGLAVKRVTENFSSIYPDLADGPSGQTPPLPQYPSEPTPPLPPKHPHPAPSPEVPGHY